MDFALLIPGDIFRYVGNTEEWWFVDGHKVEGQPLPMFSIKVITPETPQI